MPYVMVISISASDSRCYGVDVEDSAQIFIPILKKRFPTQNPNLPERFFHIVNTTPTEILNIAEKGGLKVISSSAATNQASDQCSPILVGFSLLLGTFYMLGPAMFATFFIERIVAMLKVDTYERIHYQPFILTMAIVSTVFALTVASVYTFGWYERLALDLLVLKNAFKTTFCPTAALALYSKLEGIVKDEVRES
ncbi:unnamed protein product, partial [Mesorhabditis belari]|uniref:Uncharacterized protein n=1 Tax=Mesorhabditis belari TaxID=2138241 RepID=A0AAF3FB05_9BILA